MSASVAMILLSISAAANFGASPSDPLGASAALVAAPSERPNIILITTDDQSASDMAWMPKTRAALGGFGVNFSSAISPHPLCCPARAEILTGQYAQNNGVYANRGIYGGYPALDDPDNTIAKWLQDAGYRTAFTGKFLNQYVYDIHGRPGGWDMWDPTIEGTYQYYNYVQANDGVPETHADTYITDYVAAKSRRVISRWSDGPEPFFLWASYVAPHNVCDSEIDGLRCGDAPRPEPEYSTAYAGARNPAESKPSFNERNVKDKPKLIRKQPMMDPDRTNALFLGRIRALASVDDAVADTVSALGEQGVLDNTVIIFTSDNGWLMGEHRYLGKRVHYEESVRIPLYMRGPGVPVGVSIRRSASILDIAPTLVGLAGARAGRLLDGASLFGMLTQPAASDRQTRLIQAGNFTDEVGATPWDYRGVREKRYSYVRWANGFVELYDRKRDPYQLRNLAESKRYKPVRKELRRRLSVLRPCAGTTQCYRNFGALPSPLKKSQL
jgi:N-acetylglucosamine-6-sulfatase